MKKMNFWSILPDRCWALLFGSGVVLKSCLCPWIRLDHLLNLASMSHRICQVFGCLNVATSGFRLTPFSGCQHERCYLMLTCSPYSIVCRPSSSWQPNRHLIRFSPYSILPGAISTLLDRLGIFVLRCDGCDARVCISHWDETFSALLYIRQAGLLNHIVIELLWLEETLEIIKSNCLPGAQNPTTTAELLPLPINFQISFQFLESSLLPWHTG